MKNNVVEKEVDEFQDGILRAIEHHKGPYLMNVLEMDHWMFEQCFDPAYAKAALLLMENQGVNDGDDVLVQFSGPGLDARLAHRNGAKKVVAVEKFELPHLCARYNVARNGFEGVIDCRKGDLFEPIRIDEKFDLVLANPPFRNMTSKTDVEAALRDGGYYILNRFWRDVGDYLEEGGRVRTVFSNVGDMDAFYGVAKKNGFHRDFVATDKWGAHIWINVDEFTL